MGTTRQPGRQPNTLLQQARLSQQSPSGSGRHMSRQELAEAANTYLFQAHRRAGTLDANYIGKLERGDHRWPNDGYREAFRAVLHVPEDSDLGFYVARHMPEPYGSALGDDPVAGSGAKSPLPAPVDASEAAGRNRVAETSLGPDRVELLRQGLTDVLTEGTMTDASLDDWDRTVIRYGRATRNRPAAVLLEDLGADLTELQQALHRHRSASALRRLTRVAAHMSGLMCLTLCRLDDRPAFRRWTRTARRAAEEAGDSRTHSWVLAQEAYGHYYSDDVHEAIDVAQHAQDIVRTTPCVGAALAAALEARAHAAIGRRQEAHDALARAEEVASHLDGDALVASAFGYNEAQLRFHAGSVYTHLREVEPAFTAQDRALELCAPGDYTDWAMTRLDHAMCLAYTHDATGAVDYAAETITSLTEPQRQGIVTLRGHEVLNALPGQEQALPAARDFHELLMLTTER